MKERPILYSTPMVQAKLAGRKTQTRRVIKEALEYDSNFNVVKISEEHKDGIDRYEMRFGHIYSTKFFKCPYGNPGDILWGRETWSWDGQTKWSDAMPIGLWWYKADAPDGYSPRWKPSIHMPKIAGRIWERIKSIRVERLQEINASDKWSDCVAEGILSRPYDEKDPSIGSIFYDYLRKKYDCLLPQTSYRTLWESINGPGSWELNPWVWVLTTEILSTTGRPSNL